MAVQYTIMSNPQNKYRMTISLNVLNHLGINLYSNVPAVLSEVVANSWDADATEVKIDFDIDRGEIRISDNGTGMNAEDINTKYLCVGYQKRTGGGNASTPNGRLPMGRKGIGKLSLFSIAKTICIHSRKENAGVTEALILDSDRIKELISRENDDAAQPKPYSPESIDPTEEIEHSGTVIRLKNLRKQLTQNTISGLTKRIARRFSVLGDDFAIYINGREITVLDRDYYHKARFLFQYGDIGNIASYCKKLDEDEKGEAYVFDRPHIFNEQGERDENGEYSISGWIAVARHSYDLDEANSQADNSLNNIAIDIRGKIAQEDILGEIRLGGMITKFLYGSIRADFLDIDDKLDIATSGRQKIIEEDRRYKALRSFIVSELKYIWKETNHLKESKGIQIALTENSDVKEWYGSLDPSLKEPAKKLFAHLGKINVDEQERPTLYGNAILAFETLKMNTALNHLLCADETNLPEMLKLLSEIDALEAAYYYEIIKERLKIIEILEDMIKKNLYEKEFRDYVYQHLWLLDPAWERTTDDIGKEQTIKTVIQEIAERPIPKDSGEESDNYRIDMRYKQVTGEHLIIEFKRPSVPIKKEELEAQIKKYIEAVQEKLRELEDRSAERVKGICIIGKEPAGWKNNPIKRKNDESSLDIYGIRMITYDSMVANAKLAYEKYLNIHQSKNKVRNIIERIKKQVTGD